MSMSYYDGRERPEPAILPILYVFNGVVALVAVFFWTNIETFIANPLKWATWVGISTDPGLLEYPYLLTWALPVIGILSSWIACIARLRGIAVFMGFYPALFMSMMLGWYYLAPPEWR